MRFVFILTILCFVFLPLSAHAAELCVADENGTQVGCMELEPAAGTPAGCEEGNCLPSDDVTFHKSFADNPDVSDKFWSDAERLEGMITDAMKASNGR